MGGLRASRANLPTIGWHHMAGRRPRAGAPATAKAHLRASVTRYAIYFCDVLNDVAQGFHPQALIIQMSFPFNTRSNPSPIFRPPRLSDDRGHNSVGYSLGGGHARLTRRAYTAMLLLRGFERHNASPLSLTPGYPNSDIRRPIPS